jgi:hypothetical protein
MPNDLQHFADLVCHPMGIQDADDGQRAGRPCLAMEECELLAEFY